MSVIQNLGIDAHKRQGVGDNRESGEPNVENKWSNRRYEQPGLGDTVDETGIGATEVVLNYDLVESALESGIAGKLLCNSTDPRASR